MDILRERRSAEKPANAAGHQAPSVIVDHHRQHAGSYRGLTVDTNLVRDINHCGSCGSTIRLASDDDFKIVIIRLDATGRRKSG